MRFTFLGTAASEAYPNAFCGCDNCQAARRLGGPSLRKRSSALIDDALLIDLTPDLMAACQQHGLSLARLRYCLQTHEHDDHLDPILLICRTEHCGVRGVPRLELYATAGALAKAAARLANRTGAGADPFDAVGQAAYNLAVRAVEPGQRFEVGPYRVRSLRASHDPERIVPLLYLIERDGRGVFYATDTGPLPEETWAQLAGLERPVDLLAMDHTFGLAGRSTGHLNADQFVEQLDRMRALGVVDDRTRVLAHHIGHHSNPPHDELAALARQRGYDVAYDGLVVEL